MGSSALKAKSIKSTLSGGRAYRQFFIFCTLFSFFIWLFGFFLWGSEAFSTNLFFSRCGDFLADSLNVTGYSSLLDPYNNTMYTGLAEKSYPPLVYVAMFLFSRLVNMTPYYQKDRFLEIYHEPLYLIVYIIVIFIIALATYEIIKRASLGEKIDKTFIGISVLLSAPFLYTLERGNCIIVLPALIFMFLFFRNSENKAVKEIALISLGLAFGIKLVPAVFGLLLLYEKKWLEALRAALYGAAAFLLPFLFLNGGFANIPLMFRNLVLMSNAYSNSDGCTLRSLFAILHLDPGSGINQAIVFLINILVVLLLLAASYFLRKSWEGVLAITLILILIPSNSAYYCLLYLIPVLIMFLNEKKHDSIDAVALISFILIFSPLVGALTSMKLANFALAILVFYVLAKLIKNITIKKMPVL